MFVYEPIKTNNRLMTYNWQQNDWPDFRFDPSAFADVLIECAEQSGKLAGLWAALTREGQTDVELERMATEALRTSEIEGEILGRADVVSSIRNELGLNKVPLRIADKRAEGIAALMVELRRSFQQPLTREILFHWHGQLMRGSHGVRAGTWRTHPEPMQVVSGGVDGMVIRFEAPPSDRVPVEMERYIDWYNRSAPGQAQAIRHAPVRSAIAHLYFESIHPFEDGNGRMGRALAEMALAQDAGGVVLFSLSDSLLDKRKAYYAALESAQRSNEITAWIHWFLQTVADAQRNAVSRMAFASAGRRFLDRVGPQLNPRQRKVLERMVEAGPAGFEGGMTARKYIALTRTSKATATRDLQDLADQGLLLPEGGGRSVRYRLHFDA